MAGILNKVYYLLIDISLLATLNPYIFAPSSPFSLLWTSSIYFLRCLPNKNQSTKIYIYIYIKIAVSGVNRLQRSDPAVGHIFCNNVSRLGKPQGYNLGFCKAYRPLSSILDSATLEIHRVCIPTLFYCRLP